MHIHITFITYNLYMLIACQSFPLHVLCFWHSSYLYFSCISVSIFCIFHIHSITYCSMSLTYLLSILSYLKYFHITYLIRSYTFIYILILFIYSTFVCFHLILFMYCTFICLLHVSSFFFSSFISMTYYILCTIIYIISYLVPISYLLSCSGYTPMLYYLFLTYCFIIYFLIRSCIVIYFHFYCTVILYFLIFLSFRFMTYFIPCTITYIFS